MLVHHTNAIFEDQAVYMSGNAYTDCEFHRCVLVLAGQPGVATRCRFDTCSLHILCLVPDKANLDGLIETLQLLRPGLPESPPPTTAEK